MFTFLMTIRYVKKALILIVSTICDFLFFQLFVFLVLKVTSNGWQNPQKTQSL